MESKMTRLDKEIVRFLDMLFVIDVRDNANGFSVEIYSPINKGLGDDYHLREKLKMMLFHFFGLRITGMNEISCLVKAYILTADEPRKTNPEFPGVKKGMSIQDINADTIEGKLLLAAIGHLMDFHRTWTPEEILDDLNERMKCVEKGDVFCETYKPKKS